MTKNSIKTAWSKPVLNRLGKIEDVAGANPVPVQNVNNS